MSSRIERSPALETQLEYYSEDNYNSLAEMFREAEIARRRRIRTLEWIALALLNLGLWWAVAWGKAGM